MLLQWEPRSFALFVDWWIGTREEENGAVWRGDEKAPRKSWRIEEEIVFDRGKCKYRILYENQSILDQMPFGNISSFILYLFLSFFTNNSFFILYRLYRETFCNLSVRYVPNFLNLLALFLFFLIKFRLTVSPTLFVVCNVNWKNKRKMPILWSQKLSI